MRAAILPAVIAFVVVFAVGSNLRAAPAGTEPTPSPIVLLPATKCGVPEPDCSKLAAGFVARIQAQNPGRRLISLVVIDATSFQGCFDDGTCYAESSAGGGAFPGAKPGVDVTDPPVPMPAGTPALVETPSPAPGG